MSDITQQIDFLVVRFIDSKLCTSWNLGNSDLKVSGPCLPAYTDILNGNNIATYKQDNIGLEQM